MGRITPLTLIIAFLAIVFGLMAAYTVQRAMRTVTPITATAKGPATRAVPVAAQDLPTDRPLTMADLVIQNYTPQDEIKLGIDKFSYLLNANAIVGRTLKTPKDRFAVFTTDDFYPDNLGPTVSDRLSGKGLRAVAVEVESVGMLAGHAVPGTHVDVVFRSNEKINGVSGATVTLLSDVEVLAVGQNMVTGSRAGFQRDNKGNIVTLAVAPERANRLKIVEGRGIISLLLRDPNDHRVAQDKLTPETLEGLLGIPPRKGPFVAEVYRKGNRQRVIFNDDQVIEDSLQGQTPRPQGAPQPNQAPPIEAVPNKTSNVAAPAPAVVARPLSPDQLEAALQSLLLNGAAQE